MRLSYHPEAEAEVVEATRYYEGRSPGLGARFLDEFDAAVAKLSKLPGSWPIVAADLRCYTMEKFPFGIYYRSEGEELRILVVMHHGRHPDYWRHRLGERAGV